MLQLRIVKEKKKSKKKKKIYENKRKFGDSFVSYNKFRNPVKSPVRHGGGKRNFLSREEKISGLGNLTGPGKSNEYGDSKG